ncbi:MAG: Tetratrico peptide repeat/TPR repeat [Rhodobacteraceae bacterium HLUCCA08]|nr:MAG: Tetratrico peptide repeat/TPR repeat [Rhodobacteraceae bacterium HLUCCA08]
MRRLALALATALTPLGAGADPDPGAYLAARTAGLANDYAAATRFFTRALAADPGNIALMERVIAAHVGQGQVARAVPVAEALFDSGHDSELASLVLIAHAIRSGDWDEVFATLEEGHSAGPLIDGLSQAWAFAGKGQMDRALTAFDEVAEQSGLRSIGLYHKALALALVGDDEGADEILSRPGPSGVMPTRGSVLVHVTILTRLGEFDRAEDLLERGFAGDPTVDPLRAAIADRRALPFDAVRDPVEGLATGFLAVAQALDGEADDTFLLTYARLADYLHPAEANAVITAGRVLERMTQYDLAAEAFARVDPTDPMFPTAELGRAQARIAGGSLEAGIEILRGLARSHPDLPAVHSELGDALRRDDDHAGARDAYDRALTLLPQDHDLRWWLLYVRGISHERLGDWDPAEADFRAALGLSPDQPSVLNYLGYSLVERQEKLDEALDMIETAARARPQSGAITDSLGWVLYRLGRYDEAVGHMERAVELEPLDPIITDHLGDVYWAVGRMREARFQWHRALSFDPEDDLADRIRRKLEVGLDQVLIEEGAEPIHMVEHDG